jgi:hypothetical protein
MSQADVEAARILADAANKSAKAAIDQFVNCAPDAAHDNADPNKTDSNAQCDAREAGKQIMDTSEEAFKANLKLRMTQLGTAAEDAEQWVESHGKEVWKKAQELRKAIQAKDAASKAAKNIHKFKVVFVTAVAGFFATVFVYHKVQNAKYGDAKSGADADVAAMLAEQEFQHQMENFNSITTSMEAPDIDVPRTEDPTIAVQAVEPNIEIMPPAVQAIAIQPVEITITMPTEKGEQTKTVTTTIGQVWTHGTIETKQEIERKAEDPQTKPYVYAFQDPNSCTARHCMEGVGGIEGKRWDGKPGPGGLQAEQH